MINNSGTLLIGLITLLTLQVSYCEEPTIENGLKLAGGLEVIEKDGEGPFDFDYRELLFRSAEEYLAPRKFKAQKITVLAWSLLYSAEGIVPPASADAVLLLAEDSSRDKYMIILSRGTSGPPGWTMNYDANGDHLQKISGELSGSTLSAFARKSGFWPSVDKEYKCVKIIVYSSMAEKALISETESVERNTAEGLRQDQIHHVIPSGSGDDEGH
jgi:hypothetical protein